MAAQAFQRRHIFPTIRSGVGSQNYTNVGIGKSIRDALTQMVLEAFLWWTMSASRDTCVEEVSVILASTLDINMQRDTRLMMYEAGGRGK